MTNDDKEPSGIVKANPNKLEYIKKWQSENPECVREYHRKWEKKHPEIARRRKEYIKIWRSENAEYIRQSRHEKWVALRTKVLSHYGGNPPKCACCGESEPSFLTLDHINGDGKEHRSKVGSGHRIYYLAEKLGWPIGLQILCWNCNMTKRSDRSGNTKCPVHRTKIE